MQSYTVNTLRYVENIQTFVSFIQMYVPCHLMPVPVKHILLTGTMTVISSSVQHLSMVVVKETPTDMKPGRGVSVPVASSNSKVHKQRT